MSAPEGTIREETPDDRAAIAALLTDAFVRTAEATLVERLRAEDADAFRPALVAEVDGAIVGFAALTRVALDDGRPLLALAPVAVLPAAQGMGVGSALVERLLEAVEAPVVVLGEPGYYRRFGFTPALPFGVRSAWDDMGDAWMIRFPENADPHAWRGTVRYPEPFSAV